MLIHACFALQSGKINAEHTETKYTEQQKKRECVTLHLTKIKYVESKKYIYYIACKTDLYYMYTVSFTCTFLHFLNSTYFIFIQLKTNKFSRFFCCWVYIFQT